MSEENQNNNSEHKIKSTKKNTLYRGIKIVVLAAILIAICIWAFFWLSYRMSHVSSEDAQVQAHIVTVSSRLPGRINKFSLIIGDHLNKEDFIAQLYRKPDKIKLSKEKAHVTSIQNKLLAQKANLKLTKTRIAGGIEQTKDLLIKDIAAMKVAKAKMLKNKKNFIRANKLYKSKSISEQKRDDAQYTYNAANAKYNQTKRAIEFDKQALKNAQNGTLLNPQTLLTSPKVLKKEIKVTKNKLNEAKASLKHQKTRVHDMIIKSPLTGIIDKTFVNAGDYLSPGQPILMMHDPKHVWILANIKETSITHLQVGQKVNINVDAFEHIKYSGHIKVIGQSATNQFALLPNPNPSGNFTKITQRIPVRIAIDKGPLEKLRPGMMVEVHIDITHSSNNS